ncbi:membrane transporter [Calycina marina]|uniref:Membrane transporter n=1 Tax=Calycina marina TaxID=1763456 RepID=A0A9P7YV54_9HELO|nr:membrane transporter [Calycina marina]
MSSSKGVGGSLILAITVFLEFLPSRFQYMLTVTAVWYLLAEGNEEELVRDFQTMAAQYNRPCSITVAKLDACGDIASTHGKSKLSVSELTVHIRLSCPLFIVFLVTCLGSRGTNFNVGPRTTSRNYAIMSVATSFVPLIAGVMCNTRKLGRKYTMVFGALATMAFLIGYAQVATQLHQATGNRIAIVFNRLLDILSAAVAVYTDTETAVPI